VAKPSCRTFINTGLTAWVTLTGQFRSSIIQELKERQRFNQDIAIAYFFFDFNDREKQSPSNMLAALLAQLCSQIRLEDIPAGIEQKEPQDSEVLIQILHTISKKLSFTYIVLDALDESERELVLKAVCKLADAESGNLNILITSRKEHDIENGLSTLRRMKSIDIRNTVVDTDIALFVRESLRDDPKFKKQSLELKLQIETDLRNGAQGM
jgi:hypothetical protein